MTLHSSWRGIVLAVAGSSALVVAGSASVAAAGWRLVNTTVAGIGLALLVVVLVDYPIATSFDRDGVHRRALLRRETLVWDRIDRFTRTAPSRRLGRDDARERGRIQLRPGGLVAAVGRRRYLLVNQCESRAEHELLRAVVRQVSEALADTLDPPPDGVPPTWLYRRARWGSPGRSR